METNIIYSHFLLFVSTLILVEKLGWGGKTVKIMFFKISMPAQAQFFF